MFHDPLSPIVGSKVILKREPPPPQVMPPPKPKVAPKVATPPLIATSPPSEPLPPFIGPGPVARPGRRTWRAGGRLGPLGGSFPDAPSDGSNYLRGDAAWTSGGTLSSELFLTAGFLALNDATGIYGQGVGGSITLSATAPVMDGQAFNSIMGYFEDTWAGWVLTFPDWTPRTGGNVGANFTIGGLTDDAHFMPNALEIERRTNEVSVAQDPLTALGVATKQYVDAHTTPIMQEPLTILTANVLPPLSHTPVGGLMQLIVNGRVFCPVGTQPPFTVSGNAITWTSTIWSIAPGSDVIAVYSYAGATSHEARRAPPPAALVQQRIRARAGQPRPGGGQSGRHPQRLPGAR